MIDQAVLSQAVRALLKHSQNAGELNDPFSKKQLFDEDNLISLIITLKTVPQTAAHTIQKLSLPFPIWDDQAQVCIFVRDPQREMKDKFEETGAKITKVIGLTKLRKKWKTHEAKRKLCQSYDLFLCDDRILCLLPKLLGKNFFEKKKLPIPIKLTGLDPSKVVNNSRNFTTFQFATGHCCAVRVARTTMDPEEIIKNIKSVLSGIVTHIPQKWKNIQSLHIKTSDSIALPLYASLPAVLNEIQVQAPVSKKRKRSNQDRSEDSKTQTPSSKKKPVASTKSAKLKNTSKMPNRFDLNKNSAKKRKLN